MEEFHCPYCNSVITSVEYGKVISKIRKEEKEKSQLLRTKLETELREHYEKHFSQKMKQIEDARKILNATKDRLEKEKRNINKREKVMKKSLESEIKLKFERQFQEQQNMVRKKINELEDMKRSLKRQELELRNSIKKDIEFKYENKLNEERERLAKERKLLEDRKYEVEMEKEEIKSAYAKRQINLERAIQKQNDVIDELRREADRRSLAELGDIPEEKLVDALHKEFPEDLFERFGKGRAGGDVVQTIMYNNTPVTRILYESKNERNWKYGWIEKIKADRSSIQTTYAILVSKAFPRNEKHFAIIKGIPVVSPRILPHIARIMRSSIIAIERQKLSVFEKEEKIGILYTYLSSNEFRSSASTIGDSLNNLNELRNKEKIDHEKNWTKEESEVNNITKHFTKVTSNIETIMEKEDVPLIIKTKKKIVS
jgi:hypothetical protein